MAVYTFTDGEQNSAALMNTYCANGGLVYVTSQTVGSAVSIVTVSNCFSSTYDNYRVIYSGGTGSVNTGLGVRVGGVTTNYSHVLFWSSFSATANVDSANNTASQANYMGSMTTNGVFMALDVIGPNLAAYTGFFPGMYTANDFGVAIGRHNIATAYTSLSIVPLSGTITGGTITVYGYRKA